MDQEKFLQELTELNSELAYLEKIQREAKIVAFNPIGNQASFFSSRAPVRVVFGSNRSGKSVIGFAELIACAQGYRPWLPEDHPDRIVRLADGSPMPVPNRGYHLLENLKVAGTQVFIPKFEEWVPKGMAKLKKNQLGQPVRVDWSNGSVTHILSQEMGVSAVEGSNGHYLSIDEPPREDFYIALSRGLVDYAGIAWITATPIKASAFMAELMNRSFDPDTGVDLISLSIHDNRKSRGGYLDDDAVDRFIASLPLHEIESRVHGRPAHLAGAVFPTWRPLPPYYIDPVDVPLDWPRIMVVDPAGRKPMAAVWMALSPSNTWYVYRDLYDNSLRTVEDVARRIKILEGWGVTDTGRFYEKMDTEPVALRIIDTSGNEVARTSGTSITYEFSRHGLNFVPARKMDYLASINRIQEMLQYDPTSEFGKNRPQLIVFNTCKRVAHEFLNFVWHPESAQSRSHGADAQDKPLKTNDDCIDCIRYALMSNATHKGLVHALIMAGKDF
jgi:hypothetical protein